VQTGPVVRMPALFGLVQAHNSGLCRSSRRRARI